SLLDDAQAVVANAHPPQPLQPTDGPLYYPTDFPQAAAVAAPALVDLRLDAQPPQQPPGRLAVVARISVDFVRPLLGPPHLAAHVREVQDDGDDLRVVTGVGPGRVDGQRDAVAVHQQRVLGALFRPVHGAGAGVLTAAEGPHDDAIHDDQIGVELIVLAQQ